jgi:murein tripeptide amidase MpaA
MSYLNIDEIESAVSNLALYYKNLCRSIKLPNATIEGRICHAMYIGKGSHSNSTMLITGGVHAREWGSPDICIYFAADILEAYTRGTGLRYGGKYFNRDQIRSILDNANLLIFPCVNPDGRYYSQNSEPLWRRNRNTSMSGGKPDCIGVDINRNYDFVWDFQNLFASSVYVGTSTEPCSKSQNYRGTAPFSEPETKNVVWLLDNFPQIRWFIDLHSYGENILYSWGDAENQSVDPSMNFMNPSFNSKRGLANAYKEYIPNEDLRTYSSLASSIRDGIEPVRGRKYAITQAVGLYPTSGAGDDYAYSRHLSDSTRNKIYALTIEWGSKEVSDQISFHPEWEEMQKIVCDISAGLVEFCLSAIKSQLVYAQAPQIISSNPTNNWDNEEQEFVEFLKKVLPSIFVSLSRPYNPL